MRTRTSLKISAFLLMLFFVNAVAFAQQRFEFYNGARQMGMGGASIAVVNDETSLLLNPAGLGKLRDYILTVADPDVEASSNAYKIVGLNFGDAMDPQALLEQLNSNPNQHFHARAQVFPSFVVPNFGFGVLGKLSMDGRVASATNLYHIDYRNDYAFVLGYNFRMLDGRIKLGVNTRVINRSEISESVASSSTGLTIDGMASEGLGVASDAGLILTAPWAWLPTISAVYRDIGNTAYTAGAGLFRSTASRPATTPHSLDVAVALFPIIGKGVRGSWTVEYQDVLTYSEERDQMRRIHGGFEINVLDSFFLRGGMNQRYWTAGLELSIGHYQLQLATYGEEVGTYPANQEDRRYNLKFSFRF